MPLSTGPRQALRCASQNGLRPGLVFDLAPHCAARNRSIHAAAATASQPLSRSARRPIIRETQSRLPFQPAFDKRSLYIQTDSTPNADALKFKPDAPILPENFPTPYLEYLSARSTLAPPHPSPLAAELFNVDGVTAVFYGADYITVTKDSATPWAHVKPEVFSLISETITSGRPIVNSIEGKQEEGQQGAESAGKADYDDSDKEVVEMINELLETRIRPAIQEDGGDIEFRGFRDGQVLLKLRGACRTCDSSTVTLKNGIESMLMHYIEEVKGVQQVLDQEEEIAMQEFAKFEEKLRQQKGPGAVASTGGKGTLDAAP